MLRFIRDLFQFIAFLFRLLFKLFKLVLMITGVISVSRCGGSGYQTDGNKVFYNGKQVSKDIQVLSDEFAKDDSTAYYKQYSITGADLATFVAVDKNYAKDKNTVYYCDEFREGVNYYLTKRSNIFSVTGAQPASFVSLGDGYSGYAKDNQQGYYQGEGFAVEDVATLEIISGYFLKDKQRVYHGKAPIKGSDPASFRILNEHYAQDTAQVYFYNYPNEGGVLIMPADSRSFTTLEYPYSKDASSVFFVNAKMNGVDATTFSILGNNYSKDKETVFFNNQKINGADAATFMIMPEYENTTQYLYFARDTAHVYWKDKTIAKADPASFKAIDFSYGTDRNYVFYTTKIIKGADPTSFKVYPHGVGNADSEDKNNKYWEGKKAEL